MGCIIASGTCFCLTCCCRQCEQGIKRWLGPQKLTKICYLFLIVIFTIPAIFIFFFLNSWNFFKKYFKQYIHCPGSTELKCIGQSVVFRLSLSLLCLFTIMFLIMLCRLRFSMVVNEGCFFIKYIFVVGIMIGFLWVDEQIFANFAQFCKGASIVYMILQSIILIDLCYLAGIKLVKQYDKGQTQYAVYLSILSVFGFLVALTLNILGYINFSKDWCGNTLWVNIITSIMLIILPIIQLLRFNQQNSLLTTALVSIFLSYLGFIAQFSYGNGNGGVRATEGSLTADIICSTFFFVLSMCGSIMGGTGQIKVTTEGNSLNEVIGVGGNESNDTNEQKQLTSPPSRSVQPTQLQKSNQQKYTKSYQWVKWHFFMCVASIYVSMLVTNWASRDLTNGLIKQSLFGFWVRISIQFATFLLYIWTMIVPRICPSRDFIVE